MQLVRNHAQVTNSLADSATLPTTGLPNMPYTLKSLAVLTALTATPSFAQTPNDPAAAQARYQQEVAACTAMHSAANSANCLKEARHAMAEIRRGKMNEAWQASDFDKNAVLRCEVHQGDDRADCLARIRGQGKTEGSVAGGGILRELTTTKTVMVSPPEPQPAKTPEGPRPSGLMSNCKWVPPTDWVCK